MIQLFELRAPRLMGWSCETETRLREQKMREDRVLPQRFAQNAILNYTSP
jgi:hypothetical protein